MKRGKPSRLKKMTREMCKQRIERNKRRDRDKVVVRKRRGKRVPGDYAKE